MPAPLPIRTDRDAACAAWNALLAEPGRLRSLTNFPWLPASVTTS